MKKNFLIKLIMSRGKDKLIKGSSVFITIVLVMFISVMAGCKVKSLVSKTNDKYLDVDKIIQVNRINEERIEKAWIKKIRGVYSYENEDFNFNSNIRIIKDSIIIVSIATDFGIEAMRVYFEKDSITVINRFHKTWYSVSVREYKRKYNLICELDLLEKILLMGVGDKLLTEMKGNFSPNIKDSGYCYIREKKEKEPKESICFNQHRGYLMQRILEVPDNNIELRIEYSGYEGNSNYILPTEINALFCMEGKEHRLVLYYDRWVVNESFPAKKRLSSSYRKVDKLLDL